MSPDQRPAIGLTTPIPRRILGTRTGQSAWLCRHLDFYLVVIALWVAGISSAKYDLVAEYGGPIS
jgi:hypothetical protein